MTLSGFDLWRAGLQGAGGREAAQEEDYKTSTRSALQNLAQDPSFLKAPSAEQIDRIMAVTGDPSALINQNDPLRQAELAKSNAELDNIHLQQSRLAQLSKLFGDDGTADPAANPPGASPPVASSPVRGTSPSALMTFGKIGGTSIPPISPAALSSAAAPFAPLAPNPGMPGPPGTMGPSALASLGNPAPAPAAAPTAQAPQIQPPPAVVDDNEDPAIKAMKAVVEKSRRAALIDPATYGPSYLSNQAKLAELQKTQAESVITPDNQGLIGQGKKFLDTIPNQAVQIQAQRYIDAEDPPLVPTSRTPLVQKQAWAAAQAADPTLSSTSYPVKVAVKKAYANGPEAQNIKSILTMINHIGLMDEVDDGKNLPDHNLTTQNYLSNKIIPSMNPDAATHLNDYNIYQKAVSSEGAKASRGAGSITEGELKENVGNLSANYARETRQGARQAVARLAAGKLEALNEQWNQTFPTQPRNFITPKAAAVLTKLGVDPAEFGTTGAGTDAAAPDIGSAVKDGVTNIMEAAKAEMARRAAAKGKSQ